MVMLLALMAQVRMPPPGGPGGGGDEAEAMGNLVVALIELALAIPTIVGMWAVFSKAGQPGWAAIIPIYNMYVLLRITGKPEWWLIFLICCPIINLIFLILIDVELAQRFGKSGAFAVGLIFLPFIFFPILGFGDARYGPRDGYGDRGYEDDRPRRDRYDEDEYR